MYSEWSFASFRDGNGTEVKRIITIDLRTLDIDISAIDCRYHIASHTVYRCCQHRLHRLQRHTVAAYQFHLERSYLAIVTRQGFASHGICHQGQLLAIMHDTELMVLRAVGLLKAAIDIFQLIRQFEVHLPANDGVHIVQRHRDSHLLISDAGSVLNMQFVHGERLGLQRNGIQLRRAVTYDFQCSRDVATLLRFVGDIQLCRIAWLYSQRQRRGRREHVDIRERQGCNRQIVITRIGHRHRLLIGA